MKPSEIRARRELKFGDVQKAEFKRLYIEENMPASKLAKKYKIRSETAHSFARTFAKGNLIRLKSVHRKLTPEDVSEIRSLIIKGIMQKDIAKKFGVTNGTISSINQRITWN